MKSLLVLPLLTSLCLATEPVKYQIEHINLPAEKANQLMRTAMTEKADAWVIMEAWLKDGTATVFSGTLVSTCDASQISSAVEWIYPTEFDPPEMPNIVKLDGEVTRQRIPMTTTTPTAFETRDVGTIFQIAKAVRDENVFSTEPPSTKSGIVNLTSELTQHIRNHVFRDRESREWLANFHHQRIAQFVNTEANQWILLATTITPNPQIVTTTWLQQLPAPPEIAKPTSNESHSDINYVAEWFTIDAEHAPAWLDTVTAHPDNSASYAALKTLVTAGHASRVSTRLFLSNSGTPVRNDAGDEMTYATEADPPELPNKVIGNVINGADLATEATPTAFESRKLGPTIEVDTKAFDSSDFMICTIKAELVDHDFDHACGAGKSLIHMPIFRHTKIATDTLLQNGKPHLVGVITTPVRHSPEPNVKRSDDPDDPPKYHIGGTPRTVLFLTATRTQP